MPSRKYHSDLYSYLNAFHPGSPKLLSGGASFSATARRATTQTITVQGNQHVLLLLQPDLRNPLIWTSSLAQGVAPSYIAEKIWNYANHVGQELQTQSDWDAADRQKHMSIGTEHGLWRHVSSAMTITLTNDDHTNGGWFEAFRLTDHPNQDQYATSSLEAEESNNNIFPSQSWMNKQSDAGKALLPSYVTGALKHIGRALFTLSPLQRQHPFLDIPTRISPLFTNQIGLTSTWDNAENTNWDT